MRLLVCGGRNFNLVRQAEAFLDGMHAARKITCVIHGGATGADNIAFNWAFRRLISVECYKADWEKWGNRAGPMRNGRMLWEGKPDMVLAFPGGRGTENMKMQARLRRVRVEEVVVDDQGNLCIRE
jgi:hypothetical protein